MVDVYYVKSKEIENASEVSLVISLLVIALIGMLHTCIACLYFHVLKYVAFIQIAC